ncbi:MULTISPECIES: glycosyltransferase family 1 protein [unclassified Polaromonas]|jgi:mannosyltransferase|uniref:glycosyltransferase family 4 protein n=1 Tax=unclassified Polaromonas TaxID=2638319 RepID=UPI000BC8AD33|nr:MULTISPECIES: glycosyltransferase family 1 protein [unclassified Polaromonas]OYY31863.1 MAG: hypothetical protein B7Y60_23790 [Polaromonas sp. 35-63-35]OYZ75310.1 MAG: hypothetical protein B7Y09_24620 [Polaromonas sp. 24-63-21]OZA45266.1 MAG: hypothetical protein B7X88_24825 [Polaromonas sp. 17-63-33]
MNIVIDGIIYLLQRHGGISVYFNELLKRSTPPEVQSSAILYGNSPKNANFFAGHIEMRKPRRFERYRKCQVSSEANIFHSSYYREPDKNIPTVVTVHDFTYERYVKGPRLWLHSFQKFSSIRRAQAIICISENTRKDLLEFMPDIPLDRISVVHNGVGDSFFPLGPAIYESLVRPFILFVGGRRGYKNFIVVVEALAQLTEFDLVCVGGGPLSSYEQEKVGRLLGNRFKYLNYVSDQELNHLYNQAYCLVYPSINEGFGIPVLEAMRAGCPVIACEGSSISEIAEDAAILLSQPAVEELLDAIIKLDNSQLRNIIRLKGFSRASSFSWQKTFEQTMKVYETLFN